MFRDKDKHKGFTILEVTVALGILTMGLLGISSLVVQNMQAQNINQNYLIASMLAQEGAELVRNKRDYNWLKYNWDEWAQSDTVGSDFDIIPATPAVSTFALDYTGVIDDAVVNHSSPGAKLWLDVGGFYKHPIGVTITPFSRLITIIDNLDNSIDVSVDVQWQERDRTYNYDVDFKLYNWR